MTKKIYKPGEKVPVSGQYMNIKTKKEVTCVEDEPFPPTPKPNQRYMLVDVTKHKSPRKR